MYLYARIFGVSTYFITLLSFCYLLSRKNSNTKKVLIAYCIILAIMAFLFKPATGNDLYRIYDLVDAYSKSSFSQFVNKLIASNTPISLIYYRVIGLIGIKNLLPCITSIIYYLIVFYIFDDYSEKHRISKKAQSISLLIIMCNSSFFECISGIRTMLAFSLLLKCFYDENYKNKSIIKNIPLYICACLIHSIAIVITITRLIYYIKAKIKNKKSLPSIIAMLALFSAFFVYGYSYIIGATDKANEYFKEGGYNYIWENIITVLLFILILFIQSNIKKKSEEKSLLKNKNYSRLYQIIIVASCMEHNTFFRLNNFNLFLNTPIILTSIDKYITRNNNNYRYIVVYTLMILIITCIRGNLCSLKFW